MPGSVNEKQMFRYLLDDLSDEDRREIEQLYFKDDDYFDLLSAAEDELITAYLDGRLPDHDRRRFEELYRSGAQRQKVEVVSRVRRFARQLPGSSTDAVREPKRSLLDGLFWFVLAPSAARGPGEQILVEVPKETAEIGLQLELDEPEHYARYEAQLKPIGGDEVGQPTDCQAEPAEQGKPLRLRVPSERLTDGEYALFVSGIRQNGEAEDLDAYTFSLRRA